MAQCTVVPYCPFQLTPVPATVRVALEEVEPEGDSWRKTGRTRSVQVSEVVSIQFDTGHVVMSWTPDDGSMWRLLGKEVS